MDLLDKVKGFVAGHIGDIPKPEADVTDVDLKEVNLSGVTYLAKVSVTNPYSVSIPISDVAYSLESADRVIASGTIPDPGSLKGDQTTMIEVNVKVPHSVIVSLIRDITADWDLDYELEIKLIVDLPVIGNITIPVHSKGEMKFPTFRDMFK